MDATSTYVTRHASQDYLHAEVETLPREQLAELQLRRLRDTLLRLYDDVPPVRARMQDAGVQPQDVRSLADVASLPFTHKTDLRDHYPFGLFARPVDQLARLHASSGTTGKPTVVGYTAQDLDLGVQVVLRSVAGDVGAGGVHSGSCFRRRTGARRARACAAARCRGGRRRG